MIEPFPSIPRFPEEALPADAVTRDNSLFMSEHAMMASDLLSSFVTGARSEARRRVQDQINSFCAEPTRKKTLQFHLSALIEDATAKSLNPRLALYKSLQTKLIDQSKPANAVIVQPERVMVPGVMPDLPERSSRRIPKGAFDLANRALSAVYPAEFVTLIPALSEDAVYMTTISETVRYMRAVIAAQNHIFVRQQDEKMIRELSADPPNLLKIWTQRYHPKKPIVYFDGDLEQLFRNISTVPDRDVRKAIADAQIARVLVHETIHRAANLQEPVPVSINDPLVDLAFAAERQRVDQFKKPRFGDFFQRRVDALYNFASKNPLAIQMCGFQIGLLAQDVDGQMRILVQSGYDIEEAFVDHIAAPAYDFMLDYMERYGELALRVFGMNLIAYTQNSGNYQFRDLKTEVGEYLWKLGFGDKRKSLEPFVNGRLPQLHLERLPEQTYYS